MKHKHAELIKAWADGAIIQYKVGDDTWVDSVDNDPSWSVQSEYRIKPEPNTEIKYFDRFKTKEGFIYIENHPDLEKWDLRITYQNGEEIKVEIAS